MREAFTATWAFGITGAIENVVRRNFPQSLRTWPLIQSFDFEAYELPEGYIALILKDKIQGIPAGPGIAEPFPYSDHPQLPPKVEDIELWQFYLRDKFDLRIEDAAFLIPVKDSGQHSAKADYELFDTEERMFWNHQLSHVMVAYKAHLDSFESTPQQPSQVVNTFHNTISGPNARINVDSSDSSFNTVNAETSDVFEKLRECLTEISADDKRDELAKKIDDMETSLDTPDFVTHYKEFIALAANHVALFTPALPALANMLN